MFDAKEVLTITIASGEKKSCVVRRPTDEEWAARARAYRMVRQSIGRGKSRPVERNHEKPDMDLFAMIRQDVDGPELEASEIGCVIARLDYSMVTGVTSSSGGFTFNLSVSDADDSPQTVHRLRMTSARQRLEHARASVETTHGGRFTEVRVFMEPSATLYDALLINAEGYVDGVVPINHKHAVVFELIEQVEQLEREYNRPEA